MVPVPLAHALPAGVFASPSYTLYAMETLVSSTDQYLAVLFRATHSNASDRASPMTVATNIVTERDSTFFSPVSVAEISPEGARGWRKGETIARAYS